MVQDIGQKYGFDMAPEVWEARAGEWLKTLSWALPSASLLAGWQLADVWGLAAGAAAGVLAVLFADANLNIWAERAMLREYGQRLENIYECSRSPDDNQVYHRAQAHRSWLERSGNKNNVRVHELIFREGEFVNETISQYQERVDLFIQDDRAKRHRFIRDNDRVLYLKHMKKQIV